MSIQRFVSNLNRILNFDRLTIIQLIKFWISFINWNFTEISQNAFKTFSKIWNFFLYVDFKSIFFIKSYNQTQFLFFFVIDD